MNPSSASSYLRTSSPPPSSTSSPSSTTGNTVSTDAFSQYGPKIFTSPILSQQATISTSPTSDLTDSAGMQRYARTDSASSTASSKGAAAFNALLTTQAQRRQAIQEQREKTTLIDETNSYQGVILQVPPSGMTIPMQQNQVVAPIAS